MNFSERIGIKKLELIQKGNIDSALRNSLWNVIIISLFPRREFLMLNPPTTLFQIIWMYFLKEPIDKLDEFDARYNLRELRKIYFNILTWNQVYDFIEFLANNCFKNMAESKSFITTVNLALEQEKSAYRFVGGIITPITSEEEKRSIEKTLELAKQNKLTGVNTHITTAIKLFSEKKSPDYRNSIKESISAVESLSSIIAKKSKAKLSDALEELEKKISLHRALKSGFNSLYGYTSDSGGIRHALLEQGTTVDYEEALFMLVSCSAFINYLIMKCQKNGSSLK